MTALIAQNEQTNKKATFYPSLNHGESVVGVPQFSFSRVKVVCIFKG